MVFISAERVQSIKVKRMSYESENLLPRSTSLKEACLFLELLGFVRLHGAHPFRCKSTIPFEWVGRKNYESFVGIEATIGRKPRGEVYVHTRTRVGRSYHDLAQQNRAIREIRKRFGGSFRTDAGRSRYERLSDYPEYPAAARGVLLAHGNLRFTLTQVAVFRMSHNPVKRPVTRVAWMDAVNPGIIANNLVLPFLTAGLEDFFKSSFIALLRYLPRRESFFKGARLSATHLSSIALEALTVEEAIAEGLPFQRISSICEHFKALDPKLDLAGGLKRPYRRRKSALFDDIEAMVERRHALIHQNRLNLEYTDENLDRDLNNIQVAGLRCLERMNDHFDWGITDPELL